MTKEEIIRAISDDKMMPFIQSEQLAQIVEFVINNYKTSLPSNLDEAIEEYAPDFSNDFASKAAVEAVRDAFKSGAEWVIGQGVSLSHLIAWYIQSVDAHEPIWTEEHLKELVKDYILIPKN